MTNDGSPKTPRLAAIAAETLADAVEWTVEETASGFRIVLSDRTVDIDRREGPAGAVDWVCTLRAAGDIVGKYGPCESAAELDEQLRTVLTTKTFYTVCCDG